VRHDGIVLRTIRHYSDGTSVEFDSGKFDNYCVYVRNPDGTRHAPLDTEYFETLVNFSSNFGVEKVYADFVNVYQATHKAVTKDSLSCIEQIAHSYEPDRVLYARTMTIIHMGMVAEQNKANTKLGKRIKRLGIHRLLLEDLSVTESAHFMRGLKWHEIDKMCTERGF